LISLYAVVPPSKTYFGLVIFLASIIHEVIEIKIENGTKTTIINQEKKIHESYLIAIGVVVFIILSPEIRKAKLGPVEFELARETKQASSEIFSTPQSDLS